MTGQRLSRREFIKKASRYGLILGSSGFALSNSTIYVASTSTADYQVMSRYDHLKCSSLKVEVRKTSANGANRLDGSVLYAKMK